MAPGYCEEKYSVINYQFSIVIIKFRFLVPTMSNIEYDLLNIAY